ncbi:Thiosulfate sulfurtransferase rdl2, mitochondrial [Batrachochytrium dendrobatidis]|nr:Thiosulfate sulfurtransferase rdl2, mitochondrial [Batrachochytrium dendrobatidis]
MSSNICSPASTVDKSFIKDTIISETPQTLLINVREPSETSAGMIPTAHNIPVGSLQSALALNSEEFRKQYHFDKPDCNKNITVYCRSGVRSAKAAQCFMENGYTR